MFILLFAVVLRIDTDSREMDNESDEAPPSSTDHRPELQASPLPQMMKGSLWETLATVSYDPYAPNFVPIFSDTLKKMNGKYVELVGFMIPLSAQKKQTRFVLTPYSLGGCSFCVGGGGPESLVDIRPSKPIEFTYDPITITGRLELLQKDSSELFFRISKAEVMDKGDMKNNPDDKY
jgi:hypothetical protein